MLSEVVEVRLRLTLLSEVVSDVRDVRKLVVGLEFIHGFLEVL